jgi:hypothetical protein
MEQSRPIFVTIGEKSVPHRLLCHAATSEYMAERTDCLGLARRNVSYLR